MLVLSFCLPSRIGSLHSRNRIELTLFESVALATNTGACVTVFAAIGMSRYADDWLDVEFGEDYKTFVKSLAGQECLLDRYTLVTCCN